MGYAPENTLASFEEAIRRGADCIELDVQLSRDGAVIVMHDASVDRTTDGQGLVGELSCKKIKSLNAGAWYSAEFKDEKVPLLSEVFPFFALRKTSQNRPVGFIVELKTAKGTAGILADAAVRIMEKAKCEDRTMVISFDAVALQEVRSSQKNLSTGLLYSDEKDEQRIKQACDIGAHAIFPRKSCVTSRGIVAAHKAGLAVSTWTANTKIEMKRLLACGIDAIATNYPDRLRSLVC